MSDRTAQEKEREKPVYDSDEDDNADNYGMLNKRRRRLQGACDTCKRKKIKCDSSIMPNGLCSNCISTKSECTHTIPRQTKRDRQREYIRQLEERVRQLEEAAARHSSPGSSTLNETDTSSIRHASPAGSTGLSSLIQAPSPQSSSIVKDEEYDSDDISQERLAQHLDRLSVDCTVNRYFGKSSMIYFVSKSGEEEHAGTLLDQLPTVKRPPLWTVRPWERETIRNSRSHFVFPEPDLIEILLQAHFERVHPLIPVLHRPSFMRDVRTGRHFRDEGFAMVLLAALSTGSRYSEDPRIFSIDPEYPDLSEPSAGWKYISQTPLLRKSIIDYAEIHDLQFYALAIFYFVGTCSPQTGWTLLGVAIRLCLEKGLHTRVGMAFNKSKIETELQKRIFWSLIFQERWSSATVGRPSCLNDEDIDVDYALEVDDEYWEGEVDDPSQAFQQPPGKPSFLTAFNLQLKLSEISAFMLRTLYSTKKSRILTGSIGVQWDQRIVTELNSSMNKWKASLPSYLQWDPSVPDNAIFNQQLLLHTSFYSLQMHIHRPFLRSRSNLTLPALAICNNAARAVSRIVGHSMRRQRFMWHDAYLTSFIAGTVLITSLWGIWSNGISYGPQKELSAIHSLINGLEQGEKRWHIAGRFRDMLNEFCARAEIPIPTDDSNVNFKFPAQDPVSKKRARDGNPVHEQAEYPPHEHPMHLSGQHIGRTMDQASNHPQPSYPIQLPDPPFSTLQQPPAQHAVNPVPGLSPSNSTTGSDSNPPLHSYSQSQSSFNPNWDLTTLLLAHLDYTAAGNQPVGNYPDAPASTYPVPGHDGNFAYPSSDNSSSQGSSVNWDQPQPQSDPAADRKGNPMAFWMTPPTALNMDDWNSYLAGQTQDQGYAYDQSFAS
ncbi:hypothetical protein FA15DRAFT_670334 [Coprinopsis marcescibilis]|uniref:Zn(2)-C6 fungal-type domain-containing protein n=1 Tax=Coprinopsis marcescibilis TaxID=230819 RepID=A0A5C3L5X1_COPMA|nr:hypothetical protein FA15DRAFT_670334 [Coprinopsis marcescibilis]